MDLNGFWQENKRFCVSVGVGAVLFGMGLLLIDQFYGSSIQAARRERTTLENKLRAPLFSRADQDAAQGDRDALAAARDELVGALRFRSRPEFRLDPAAGAATHQYLLAVAEVQDELLPRAARANLVVPRDLGLPATSPTREDEVQCYLEALDALEQVLNAAIEAGAERAESIVIKLDAARNTRQGVGPLEVTRIELVFVGEGLALTELLQRTQSGPRRLWIEELDLVPARGKRGEARLGLTLQVLRFHDTQAG